MHKICELLASVGIPYLLEENRDPACDPQILLTPEIHVQIGIGYVGIVRWNETDESMEELVFWIAPYSYNELLACIREILTFS